MSPDRIGSQRAVVLSTGALEDCVPTVLTEVTPAFLAEPVCSATGAKMMATTIHLVKNNSDLPSRYTSIIVALLY